MKAYFDTSALVAALVKEHDHHERAFPYLDRVYVGEMDMAVSTHALAELYSTLTVLKAYPKITPRQAQRTIKEDVLPFTEVVPLDASDYEAVINRMADLGLVSGAIYDALHVRAAEKAGVDQLSRATGATFAECRLKIPSNSSCSKQVYRPRPGAALSRRIAARFVSSRYSVWRPLPYG